MATSKYDPNQDKLVRMLGNVPLNGGKTQLEVAIYSYAGAAEKISVRKVGTRANGQKWYSTNIGRLLPAEAAALAVLLTV